MLGFDDFLFFGYIINFILTIIVVCFQRRDPQVTLLWVLVFILIPVGGLLAFIVFGLGVKRRTQGIYDGKHQQANAISKKLYEQMNLLDAVDTKDSGELDLIRYFCKFHALYTENNKLDIFTDAKEKYEQLLDDIENAKESIELLYFIVRKDDIGTKIMDALVKKANEGVEVRFLYDSFGTFFTSNRFLKRLDNTKCGKSASFYPVSIFTLSKINHRNHRKIVVIDKKISYLGGMNIGDEYMGLKKPSPWRDTHLRIEGDAAKLLYQCFCFDWDFATHDRLSNSLSDLKINEAAECEEAQPMQIVSSGPDSSEETIKCGMLKMIYSARRYLYIQSPYFIPDQSFRNALVTAAESGVDVRLMIPGIPDKKYVYYSSTSYLDEMLRAGVRVYFYNGFIHSKMIVADDKISTIGTTNIDIRSFRLHFETNAFFYSDKIAVRCREIFEKDIGNCRAMTLEEYEKRPLKTRAKEGFFRLFSPIM